MAHRILQTEADLAEWFPAPGYEDRYEITRTGMVRGLPRYVNSPVAGGQRRIAGRVLALQMVKGYPAFQTRDQGGRKHTVYVHRLVAAAFVPNPDNKPHVNHIDGDKSHCSPANLEWVTHAENMKHARSAGLAPAPPASGPGEQSPAAKLSWDDVERIRSLLAGGMAHAAIACRFGVKKSAIGCIARGETWRVGP